MAVWAVPNKLDAANTKLDDLAITVSDQGALNLRIHIEDDLADPGNHPLALFEVPEANGGHLSLVRSIVADTIAKMQATGQGVGNAQPFLAAGDAAKAAGDYKGGRVRELRNGVPRRSVRVEVNVEAEELRPGGFSASAELSRQPFGKGRRVQVGGRLDRHQRVDA